MSLGCSTQRSDTGSPGAAYMLLPEVCLDGSTLQAGPQAAPHAAQAVRHGMPLVLPAVPCMVTCPSQLPPALLVHRVYPEHVTTTHITQPAPEEEEGRRGTRRRRRRRRLPLKTLRGGRRRKTGIEGLAEEEGEGEGGMTPKELPLNRVCTEMRLGIRSPCCLQDLRLDQVTPTHWPALS